MQGGQAASRGSGLSPLLAPLSATHDGAAQVIRLRQFLGLKNPWKRHPTNPSAPLPTPTRSPHPSHNHHKILLGHCDLLCAARQPIPARDNDVQLAGACLSKLMHAEGSAIGEIRCHEPTTTVRRMIMQEMLQNGTLVCCERHNGDMPPPMNTTCLDGWVGGWMGGWAVWLPGWLGA